MLSIAIAKLVPESRELSSSRVDEPVTNLYTR